MTVSEPAVAIAMAFVFILAYAWVRSEAKRRTGMRIRQMENATALLRSHTEALDRFLSDPDAPEHLRAFLLRWSYAMDDRAAVLRAVEAAARTGMDAPREASEETDALRADLDGLERSHPALAKTFETAIRTGTFGAMLRWPESADLFERAVANVEAEPDRELGIAVATAARRGGIPVGMPNTVAAA